MKKLMILALGLLLVLGLAGPATAYDFQLGFDSGFSGPAVETGGDFLVGYNANLADGQAFSLNSGDSWTYNFATLEMVEWPNTWPDSWDEYTDLAITAKVDFAIPDLDSELAGVVGSIRIGFGGLWRLEWDEPEWIAVSGGRFKIDLTDFEGQWLSCPQSIDMTVSYEAVPIPAAVWLLGSGLVGLAGLRRKFR